MYHKNILFNRSAFSEAKGHDVKRKSSKGLATGIALAGTIVLLGSGQLVSADDLSVSESTVESSAAAEAATEDKKSQPADSSQLSETASADDSPAADSESKASGKEAAPVSEAAQGEQGTAGQAVSRDAQLESSSAASAASREGDEDEDEDDEDEDDEEENSKKHRENQNFKKADIAFDASGVRTSSSGVSADGKNITITSAGTYTLAGSASGYSIVIADQVTDRVKLKFDAVNLSESTIYSSRDLEINILSDSSVLSSLKNTVEIGGALYLSSKKKSSFSVSSTAGHAIKADRLRADKVNLILSSASKDGIHAASSVTIKESAITISAGDDGIQAGNRTDVNAGDVEINDSAVTITSTHKGITAHDEITVKGSTALTITAGFEGMEGRYVHLKKGHITIKAGDDAINAVEWTGKDDADLSALTNSKADIKNKVAIVIAGADVAAVSNGDGMDSNGDLLITGGSLKTQSVTDYNSALDYDGTALASGGRTWAIGHMGFAQGFSSGTKQAYLAAIVSGLAGDTIRIRDSKGRLIAETKAEVDFDHVVFSDKDIKDGKTYTVTSSDGHQATVRGTKQTTAHPSGRKVSKDTVPLLPNGHHPAFPGNGTPPSDKGN
ncbi:carbohydrate-binding domain-containing protein [Streptococcus panodentis]|uniref:Signal peptide protein n=1 Tax=Streptococcus panodentis TaxID=1581472 RepID=A0ABS5AXF0_9STRE|nr:carbohydrate-binding domain-containing protein [Streptococcus panodentis]MBP2621247.1 signal peptide protein [Streptococcus panodentis]